MYSFCDSEKFKDKSCLIMGIVNLHPDSFSSVGRITDPVEAADYAVALLNQGADLIDLGAEPTNPQQKNLANNSDQTERTLLKQACRRILDQNPKAIISLDTSSPKVIAEAEDYGAKIINDVRALRRPGALEAFAKTRLHVCLMHMAYPDGLQIDQKKVSCSVDDIAHFLKIRVQACEEAGIPRKRIMIDPGIGGGSFGKSPKEDLAILSNLQTFQNLQLPICLGLSRKSFMQKLLDTSAQDLLLPSLILGALAAASGVNILRVHDVLETKKTLDRLNA